MKAYHKLQKYLLENYPLLWHSRVTFLFLAGFFGWVVSYLIGYAVSADSLTHFRMDSYYFSGSFIFYHLIFLLVVFCLWALSFFKNNPLRALYPISHTYLIKLFLLLFAGFFFLVSFYFPFTYGLFSKTKKLLPVATFEQEVKNAQIAQAFLATDASRYHISNKIFPPVFKELKTAANEYDQQKEQKQWSSSVYPFSLSENAEKAQYDEPPPPYSKEEFAVATAAKEAADAIADNDYSRKQDSISRLNKLFFDSVYHSGYGVMIDSVEYLFYKTDVNYLDKDSCYTKEIIKEFVRINDSLLHIYSLTNFVNSDYDLMSMSDFGNDSLCSLLYRITLTRDSAFVHKTLADFETILKKYKINHRLYPAHITHYLTAKDYTNIHTLTETYEINYLYDNYPANKKMLDYAEANMATLNSKQFSQYESILTDSLHMFFVKSELATLTENYVAAHNNDFEQESFFVSILICGLIVAFFVLMHITHLKSFLIAIPIAGVIFFAVVIFVIVFRIHSDSDLFTLASMVNTGLLLFCLFAIFSKKISKRITDIAFNIGAAIAVYILPLLYATGSILTKTQVYDCQYTTQYLYEPNKWIVLLLAFAGCFGYLLLVKKWRSKPE